MKSSTITCLAIVLSAVVALGACKGREHGGDATETIAPAQPQPAADTGTEGTQTVDIEDSRSEADGAALNNTATTSTTTTTTTSTTSATATTKTTT